MDSASSTGANLFPSMPDEQEAWQWQQSSSFAMSAASASSATPDWVASWQDGTGSSAVQGSSQHFHGVFDDAENNVQGAWLSAFHSGDGTTATMAEMADLQWLYELPVTIDGA